MMDIAAAGTLQSDKRKELIIVARMVVVKVCGFFYEEIGLLSNCISEFAGVLDLIIN